MEETNRVPKDEGILNNIYLDGICQTLGLYNMALAGCAHIWELWQNPGSKGEWKVRLEPLLTVNTHTHTEDSLTPQWVNLEKN